MTKTMTKRVVAFMMIVALAVVMTPTDVHAAAKLRTGAKIKSAKSIKYNTVRVKMKKGKGKITGYQIAMKRVGKKWHWYSVKTKKKTYTFKEHINKRIGNDDTLIKASTKYKIKVRAYKVVNGKKVYSKWSKTKTIKTKKLPKSTKPANMKAGKTYTLYCDHNFKEVEMKISSVRFCKKCDINLDKLAMQDQKNGTNTCEEHIAQHGENDVTKDCWNEWLDKDLISYIVDRSYGYQAEDVHHMHCTKCGLNINYYNMNMLKKINGKWYKVGKWSQNSTYNKITMYDAPKKFDIY